jgi:hypothetical protein
MASRREALIAAGRAHLAAWKLEEALTDFDRALQLRPADPAATYLRGEALFLQRRFEEALDCHAAALRHGMDRDVAARGRAMSGLVPGDFGWMSHMQCGDFESAWRLADRDREECRRAGIDISAWPRHTRPVWDGTPLDGKRVLVRCWRGLGDTIQFVRYVPLLAHDCTGVCVEAPPELLPLLRRLPGIERLVPLAAAGECDRAERGCDAEIEAGELPHAFRTTIETIPAAIPYLLPDPAVVAEAKRRLAHLPPGLRVGLAWAAGPWKPERSVPLRMLAAFGSAEGVSFVNLQGGAEYRRRRGLTARGEREGPAMADFGTADDIAGVAAVIVGLDLVITVDTMVAHLAGALGVPVWLMLHFAADWRWLTRHDSPWYPTMRLYRQPRPGIWDAVVGAIAAALRAGRVP